ncbi:hypothetical protein TNCV_1585841 [Trichonephila clavipes]|nr:hypothetical protein TNCV_1585841 [Trichonephila clavipes]
MSELEENQLLGQMDNKQLKAKIKSIKDVYRTELNKIEKSKKSGCGVAFRVLSSKGSSTRGEFTSYKPAFLQAARKLAQCTHRTRLKAAFKKALEKVDSAGDFTRHSPAFERFRL